MKIGFIGLRVIGKPIALILARHFPITAWNRSPSKYAALEEAGVRVGTSPSHVVGESDIVFTMLFDVSAFEPILDDDFSKALRGKVLINTSSVPVNFSKKLAGFVHNASRDFVEMPVSSSKVPAEQGKLVSMIAGDRDAAKRIRPIVEPLTTAAVYYGPVGSGLKMKYAINLYLVAIAAGLSESMNLAHAQGLDLEAFAQVLSAGPITSPYSSIKVPKMLKEDWSPQASVKDCYNSTLLIQSAAQSASAWSPITQLCVSLYKQAQESGLGEEDMTAIVKLFSKDRAP
jgi:3-hydroxyisobutyrate dehydrogenase-like beta-hydroxyacid dehydrogenase